MDSKPTYPDGSLMTPEDDSKDMQPRNPDGTLKTVQKLSRTTSQVYSKTLDPDVVAKTKDAVVTKVPSPSEDETGFANYLDLVDRRDGHSPPLSGL